MKKVIHFVALLLVTGSAGAQYNSLLWKISGNGLKQPSYLFGTMHTSDSRVIHMSDTAMKYFNAAKSYAMELDPKKAMDLGAVGKLMMGKDYSLKKMLPEREYKILDSLVDLRLGFRLKLFDNVAPVFMMTILEMEGMGLNESDDKNAKVLDLYLYDKAQKQKKRVIGIESVSEQLDALNSISYQEQANMLVKEINSMQERQTQEWDVLRLYLEQKLDSLASSETDSSMPEKFYNALVVDRNKRMASRIGDFIPKQSAFIAVGALHLPGEKGVIALLRKQGFAVEAVE
jgi:uncharacterized protein YbaP (TraB family)